MLLFSGISRIRMLETCDFSPITVSEGNNRGQAMRLQEIKEIGHNWFHSALVRQFAANSFWMTVARCAWILSAFTVGILVARKLGPKKQLAE